MKAVILIGGLGTRLRPFTLEAPKPLLLIANRPSIFYQLDLLKKHGIREIILCVSYQHRQFKKLLGDGRKLGLKIFYSRERTPMGTGGAVKLAERFLNGPTLVLNGDVLSTLNFKALIRFHRKNRAEITITLTRVKDPTRYGLVETDPAGRVQRFLEKPSWEEATTDTINAGAYVFEPAIMDQIPAGVPYSLERGLFPHLLETGRRFSAYVSEGYWIDIGNIPSYLQVHSDILDGKAPFSPPGKRKKGGLWREGRVRIGNKLIMEGRAAIGAGTKVGSSVRLAGAVSIGPGCSIGDGASLENCVILQNTLIGESARLSGCVVGGNCRIGTDTAITSGTALGSRSIVAAHSQL